MAVNTTENVKSYACGEDVTDFSFPFSITGTDTSVIIVTIWDDATSTPTVLSEESGAYSYSVAAPNNNYENGGTVSTTKLDGAAYIAYAYDSGNTITIERVVPYTQPSEFAAGGLNNKALEQTFDNLEFQIQQLDKRKSIHGPPSDPITSIYEIPGVTARKGRVLGFDDTTGDVVAVSALPTSGVSITAFGETLIDDNTAVTAQGTLKLKDSSAELDIASLTAASLTTEDLTANDLITKGPWIDVRAFGATGNGVTDDTAALQSAIDAATAYGTVVLPPGTYKFSQLKFYNPIVFTGLGAVAARWNHEIAGVTLLHDESTDPAIIIGGTTDSVIVNAGFYSAEGITLANFFLYPTGATANVGILIDGSTTISASRGYTRNIRFENVTVRTFGSNNIKIIGNVFDVRFKGGGSRATLADGVVAETAVSEGSDLPGQLYFYDFYSQAQTGDWNFKGRGIHLYGGGCAYGNGLYAKSHCQVYGTHFEGLTADPASIGIQIVGQYGIFCPGVISQHDTAIKIGDGTANVARYYFINATLELATTGIHITDSADRTGSGVIYFSDVTTDIVDDRATTDNVYNSLKILNDTRRIEDIRTLDNTGTPSVGDAMKSGGIFLSGGTEPITDFDDGYTGQVITIIAEHSITITDGTNIFLNGSANFVMLATDTLTLVCKADNKWYEISRSDNT